jgi:hypothetical protein
MSSMAPSPVFLQIALTATIVVLSQIAGKSFTCKGITYRARSQKLYLSLEFPKFVYIE